MTNRGSKTNAVAVTTVLSSKPVVSREKVRNDLSGVSATVKQNEIDNPISDASSGFDVGSATSNKASKPLPAILTPIYTPRLHDEENEETAFKLHPSPTPTIEESTSTMDAHPEARSPIRIPKGAKSAKQRIPSSQHTSQHTGSSSGIQREKHKRSSPDDDSKIKKKARESTTSSNVTEKKDDVNGFKIPLKPAQERVDRFSSHPSHSYNSAANSSRSAGRGRGSYWRGGRSTYQSSRPSYRSWDFAGQAFNRPPANNQRICNLTEEQFRWLDQMPVSWRRQY